MSAHRTDANTMEFSITSLPCWLALWFAGLTLVAGCQPYSESVTDASAGLNGGFEIDRNGLPVNWLMYTPRTVDEAEFSIRLDREIVKEGQQSLRFEVARCSAAGGRYSPGFTNEFVQVGKYPGPAKYTLSFWIRNNGAEYVVMAGGVSAMRGNMRVLVRDDAQTAEWQRLSYTIDVADDQWLRMELNILRPGTFWIDDVEIERLD